MYVSAISIRFLSGRSTPALRPIQFPPQPCRCLCRGFEQSTRTTPARRMTLHFLQMALTDARTFIARSPHAIRDPTTREVERRELDCDLVARRDPDVAQAHAPGNMRQHLVPVVEVHPEHGVGHQLRHRAAHRDRVPIHGSWSLQGKLKIYGPFPVTATECSKCAESRPSRVAAVHPSSFRKTSGPPAFTIGSIASTRPSLSRTPRAPVR